jgi:hypothetical protein
LEESEWGDAEVIFESDIIDPPGFCLGGFFVCKHELKGVDSHFFS